MADKKDFLRPPPTRTAPVRKQRCGNCACFADGIPARMPTTCRLGGAPQLIGVPGPGGATGFIGMWPPVEASDWCPKWEKIQDPENVYESDPSSGN